eukprot:scaffold40065_cov16-Tisochrysis_lutea.AAC.1
MAQRAVCPHFHKATEKKGLAGICAPILGHFEGKEWGAAGTKRVQPQKWHASIQNMISYICLSGKRPTPFLFCAPYPAEVALVLNAIGPICKGNEEESGDLKRGEDFRLVRQLVRR